MRVRVPASSANIGPGFDSLGLALDLWMEVAVHPASSLEIRSVGQGSEVGPDRTHLAAQILRQIHGHDNFSVDISSAIPMGRGLGSSASLVLGVAAASGAKDPLGVAVEYDGHPENAAASFYGGLVAAAMFEGSTIVRSFPVDDDLRVIAVVPEFQLSTELARAALPPLYSRADVIHNLSRVPLLLAGLADASQLQADMFSDRIHQPHRSALHPFAQQVMQRLVQYGCLGACWSGAGPTLLGVVQSGRADQVAHEVANFCQSIELAATVDVLSINRVGIEYLD